MYKATLHCLDSTLQRRQENRAKRSVVIAPIKQSKMLAMRQRFAKLGFRKKGLDFIHALYVLFICILSLHTLAFIFAKSTRENP